METNKNNALLQDVKPGLNDLICFCHLRWNFVYQRPQHLMRRFAKQRRVFYVEDPLFGEVESPQLQVTKGPDGLYVVVPHLPHGLDAASIVSAQQELIDELLEDQKISPSTLWYYTPLALAFSEHLVAETVVYDCMDELSAFKFAPPELKTLEAHLFELADVVFTGGHTLYQAKKEMHLNIHPFPSSIDRDHFKQARTLKIQPSDQRDIPHPRLGFYGVIDERMDIDLIRYLANARPHWHIVMIGPVVKIDPATLPQLPNIHYLGKKEYEELPLYLASWDVALLPFALNESTRFISPTKTPEYLAGGKPVVSTPINDVVHPYGKMNLVQIAFPGQAFVKAVEKAMGLKNTDPQWLERVDEALATNSWDATWRRMAFLEEKSRNQFLWGEASLSKALPQNQAPTVRASGRAMGENLLRERV